MTVKRQTQIKKIPFLDQLLETVTDQQQKDYLESFKTKLDFARYYLDNYEDGVKKYNTSLSEHDITLIVKANAEAFIFVVKSALDCLANFLNKRFILRIDKVQFNYGLQRKLAEDNGGEEENLKYKISCLIVTFLNDNDYLFKLRNLASHNTVIKANYAVVFPPSTFSASFQEIGDATNIPADLKIDHYAEEIIDRLYKLSGRIFDEIVT